MGKKKKSRQRSRIVDDDEVYSREGVVNGDGGIGDSGEYDLFDKLPEEMICPIVSLLPFKDAVATSVLSKEWASRWKTCLSLDLDLDTFSRPRWRRPYTHKRDKLRDISFVAWVDFVLGCHQGKELQTFRVSCALNKAYTGCIDRWVSFALRKRVSTMVIDLDKYVYVEDKPEDKYVFPPGVLSGCHRLSFLKHLTLKGVSLGDLNFACFESLESLTLESTTVSQKLIDDILSKCVHLLTLSIVTCHCPSSILEFRFPPDHPLKRLNFSRRARRIISSIYYFLKGIHVESSLGNPECMFNTIPSSTLKNTKTVSLFQYSWLDEIETVSLTFGEPAHDASLIESLRLSVYTKDEYSWDLWHGALSPPPLPDFSILRCVSMRGHNVSSLSVMISWLLQVAPALHTLELYWECREKSLLTAKNIKYRKKYFQWLDHENLKVVKVFGFHFCQSNLDILVKILESAPNLADLQFHGSDGHYHFFKIKKWLAEKSVPSEQKVRFVENY